MMKKVLFSLIVLILPLVALAQAGVYGDEIFAKCEEGAWLYYKIISEEEKTCQLQYITYFAPKDDHHFDPYEGHITIPESVYGYTVTELGNGNETMFPSMICKVTSVTIPNTVRKINAVAFNYPSELTTVEIPEGVIEIGYCAFQGCRSLTSATIPGSVRTLGTSAFNGCHVLTTVSLSEGLETIGRSCFDECLQLRDISIPSSVTVIGDFAFQVCKELPSIVLPEGLSVIGNYLFNGCTKLESVNIPEGVWFIGECAFTACSSLKTLTIPSGVSFIGPAALLGTGENHSRFDVYSLIENPQPLPAEISVKSNRPERFQSVLHVPKGTLSKYIYTPGWKGFDNYVETDMTGVEQVSADGTEVVSRYSLDGRQLTSPAKGLNIVRMKDGSVRKVIVR